MAKSTKVYCVAYCCYLWYSGNKKAVSLTYILVQDHDENLKAILDAAG